MKLSFIFSANDPASAGLKKAVEESCTGEFIESAELIFSDAHRKASGDILIFLSRHESEKKLAALLVHSPGNWGKALHGGMDRSLCRTDARFIRSLVLSIRKNAIPGYETGMECTHHGPFADKPAIFVEIGSSPAEWTDRRAALAIARSLADLSISDATVAVGIGGPHYAPLFNKLLDKGYAFGHICPKYMLHELDESMLKQAMDASGASIVYLDWKGLGPHKERILEILQKSNIRFLK